MAVCLCFFFFNDTATTEIYTLSLHDALPICRRAVDDAVGPLVELVGEKHGVADGDVDDGGQDHPRNQGLDRSEEHTSELQSRQYLVCRLLLEKKTNHAQYIQYSI